MTALSVNRLPNGDIVLFPGNDVWVEAALLASRTQQLAGRPPIPAPADLVIDADANTLAISVD